MKVFYGVTKSYEGWEIFETHLEFQGGLWWVAKSNPDKFLIQFRNYEDHYVKNNFSETREGAIEQWRKTIRRRAQGALEQWERLTKLAGTEIKWTPQRGAAGSSRTQAPTQEPGSSRSEP